MGKTGDNSGLHIVAFPEQKRMCKKVLTENNDLSMIFPEKRECVKKVVLIKNNDLSMIFPPNSIFPPAALASSMVCR